MQVTSPVTFLVVLCTAAQVGFAAVEEVGVHVQDDAALEYDAEAARHFLDKVIGDAVFGASRPLSLREALTEIELRDDDWIKCAEDLGRWAVGLAAGKTWALQMVDSASKLVTGVLYGNLADMGNFDECVVSTPGTLGTYDDFTGRYALPVIHIRRATNTTAPESAFLQRLAESHLQPRYQRTQARAQNGNDTQWKTLVSLQFAFCAPSTCQPKTLEMAVQYVFRKISSLTSAKGIALEAELSAEKTSLYSGWRQPDTADWVVGAVCIILGALVTIATVLDLMIARTPEGVPWVRSSFAHVVLAFSAYTNGKRLLTVNQTEDNLSCINGIRFLSSLWVILGHRYRYAADGVPFMNLITMPKRITDNIFITIIPGAILSVDTFFMVGGMVNAYSFMRTVKKTKSFDLIHYYLHRYIRLTPALLLIVGITATWFSLLGNGPIWYATAGKASQHCRQSWWTHPLYLANYINPDSQCVVTWYLMVDMQLHWLSPLALVPLWKSRRFGVFLALVLIALSCAVPFVLSWVYEFRTPIPANLNDPVKQDREMDMLYYPTHMRATSYLVGMLVGCYLYRYRAGKFTCRLSTARLTLGWLLSTALCLVSIFGSQPLFDITHTPYNKLQSSLFIGFYRLAWTIGISWVVVACIIGRGGPVNSILSWTPFTVLGRLTYGMYLTHALVQFVDVGTNRTSAYYSDFKMVEGLLSDACFATFFATILTLFLESPISAIEKLLRSRSKQSNKPSATAVPASTL